MCQSLLPYVLSRRYRGVYSGNGSNEYINKETTNNILNILDNLNPNNEQEIIWYYKNEPILGLHSVINGKKIPIFLPLYAKNIVRGLIKELFNNNISNNQINNLKYKI